MAESIVSLAIERITDLLIHEASFLKGVSKEVESLKAELVRMQSFLRDVDRQMDQDVRLRQRVTEIRSLAYDAEDVIDSYILRVANQEGFNGITSKFTSIFTEPYRLHKIGEQIQAIQTQLGNISKTLDVYSIPEEGQGSASSTAFEMLQRFRRTYSHVEVDKDVVTLEVSMKDVLAQLMTEEDRLHAVVSIVGMGGIGKTTLAKKIYNHDDVRRHFDCLAWCFVSQQCKPREILRDVLIKVVSPPQSERELIDKLEEHELVRRVFDVLQQKLYLVVLDDIWKIEDWNSLKSAFPRGKMGSKILFTTRNMDVALLVDPCNSPIQLPFLTEDESWLLFKKKAFPRNTTNSDASFGDFEMLGREMVRKCGGLPLAIVVLGGLLATKQSRAQWEMVHRSIHAHLNKLNRYGTVNGILALSYNDLPYYLKPCFLYLGHYPEDWEISKKELIRLWIAERFISPSLESEGMLMEDVAEQFLDELINRCLVQVGRRDYTGISVKTCRVHDLLRDLCMKKARDENFLLIIDPSVDDVTLTATMPRRIAIHPSKRDVCLNGKHPKLRSLLLFQGKNLIGLKISECNNFNSVNVLTLVRRRTRWVGNSYFGGKRDWPVSNEIGNLHFLRYLRLEYFGGKLILPLSIGKLKSLLTLHLFGAIGLEMVPNLLFKLERLRHIILSRQFYYLPRDTLKNIETLKYIGVKNLIQQNAELNFPNVQDLGIVVERSEDVGPTSRSLSQLQRLRKLDIKLDHSIEMTFSEMESLSQCHHLSKLMIRGKLQEDPCSSHHVLQFLPANIVKLTLENCKMKQDPMPILENQPHLRMLGLMVEAYTGTKLTCSANGFPQLDSLHIAGLKELVEWEIKESTMPHLRRLILEYLPQLKMLPEGLRNITSLQEMELIVLQMSLVERIQVIEGKEGHDFYKVRHIPSIQIRSTWA